MDRSAAIHQFQAAWKADFGEDLSEVKVQLKLQELVSFHRLLSKPVPTEKPKGEKPAWK